MDQEPNPNVNGLEARPVGAVEGLEHEAASGPGHPPGRTIPPSVEPGDPSRPEATTQPPVAGPVQASRRDLLRYGVFGLAGLAACGATAYYLVRRSGSILSADVFRHDAPQGELWETWLARGWAKEGRHYLKLGRNVQCKICPNQCLLEPEDRSHCRTRVNKDGTLYTLAYGNPCAFHVDPIEKKPLFHFLPGTEIFSIATAGCVYRCLNCQNWDISQAKPDETKNPRGEEIRLRPESNERLSLADVERASMFPEDVVALAEHFHSPSIAYTYSEPTAWYEYMIDTCRLARQSRIKNVWVTCGSMQGEALAELCEVLDAANVDLKSFSDTIYRNLNAGKLQTVLDTLVTLKQRGIWFEVTNLVVPTYTDDLEMIRRMCDWLVEHVGPDYPLHFSRFHPAHKLAHLPPTPLGVLVEARDVARRAGLHYVYLGNVRGVDDAETTFCPGCHKAIIERIGYFIRAVRLEDGKCAFCKTRIAGVWSA